MNLGLDFLGQEDLLDNAFLIDDEGRAESTEVLTTVHALLTPHTELFHELVLRVGNQGERQVILLNELLVRSTL